MESVSLSTGLSASTPTAPTWAQAATLPMNFALANTGTSTQPPTSAIAFEQILSGLMFPQPIVTSTEGFMIGGEKGNYAGLPPWMPPSSKIGENLIAAGGGKCTTCHPSSPQDI